MERERQEPEVKGAWWRLQGIFLEPTRTFQFIRHEPNWVLPVAAAALIALSGSLFIVNTIGLRNIIEMQVTARSATQQMPPEQLDQIVDQALESPIVPIMMYASPVLGVLLVTLASAGIFLMILFLAGGESTFLRVFSVTGHTFFFYYLVYSGLSVVVILLTPDPTQTDLESPVRSNLGFLVSRRENPALYSAASSADLISFYHIYLLALGLSVVSQKTSFRTCLAAVVIPWLLYVGGKAALAASLG